MAQSFATTPQVQSALLSRADLRQAYCSDVSATHHRASGKTGSLPEKRFKAHCLMKFHEQTPRIFGMRSAHQFITQKNLDQGNRPQAIRQDSSEVLLLLII